MPIDLSLLLTSRDEIIKWQASRTGCSSNDIEVALDHILSIENRRRILRAELNQAQARLNECKKLLQYEHHESQSKGKEALEKVHAYSSSLDTTTTDTTTIHKINTLEIERLKLDIPLLSKRLNDITTTLQRRLLPKIGNVLDERDFSYYLPIPNPRINTCKYDFTEFIRDPLFCLNWYQSTQGFDHSHKDRIFLSGIGLQLTNTLSLYGQSYFSTMNLLDTTTISYPTQPLTNTITWIPIHCPYDVEVDIDVAHSSIGCPNINDTSISNILLHLPPCPICNSNNVNSTDEVGIRVPCPSYMSFLLLHREKTYHDNQLPIGYISTVTHPPKLNNDKKSSRKSLLSFQLAHPSDSIELYILSSSSLALSSKIQENLAKGIISFYKSFLPMSQDGTFFHSRQHQAIDNNNYGGSGESWIRARTLPPKDLSMNESRRILIEGYLPSKQIYVELGHVSNFTDFISRELQIYCGDGKKDFVHVVHGYMNSTVVLLEFLLENNIMFHGKERRYGILLPNILSNFMSLAYPNNTLREDDDDNTLFLPFCKRMVKGKGGKITIVDIEHGSNNDARNGIQPIEIECRPDRMIESKVVDSSRNPPCQDVKITTVNVPKFPIMTLHDPKQKVPTLRDIQYERITSFPFLPFYSS